MSYYQKHKEEILARARERYANDKEFREQKKGYAKTYVEEHAEETAKRQSQYKKDHAQELKEYNAEYWELHQEEYSKKRKQARQKERIVTAE